VKKAKIVVCNREIAGLGTRLGTSFGELLANAHRTSSTETSDHVIITTSAYRPCYKGPLARATKLVWSEDWVTVPGYQTLPFTGYSLIWRGLRSPGTHFSSCSSLSALGR